MKLSQLQVDVDLATGGTWCDFARGVRFLIASTGSHKFKRARFLAEDDPSDRDPNALYNKSMLRAIAEHVWLGWEGLDDEDGKPIPYSPEKAYEILCNPGYFQVLDFVLAKAQDVEQFKAKAQDKNLGN